MLDESLIIAIISDFDLTQHYDEAHGILQTISSNVATEEASGFNSNGLSGGTDGSPMGAADDPEWPPESSTSASTTRGLTDTSVTDFSDTLSDRFEALELPKDVNIATLDEDGKIAELKLIFPTLRPYDVSHTLKKVEGDFTRACEELLNMQYLEENGLRARGIEGAFRPDELVGYKKGKKRAASNFSAPVSGLLSFVGLLNAKLQLTCIAGRLDHHTDRHGKKRLEVAYNLTPLSLSEDDMSSVASSSLSSQTLTGNISRPRPVSLSTSISMGIASAPSSPATKPTDWQTVPSKRSQWKTYSELAADSADAQETTASSFAAAQRAWRRGRSDIHFRPVASVYAERAREQLEAFKVVDARKYEALVDEQSSSSRIDLHGVPVSDGVRIALERAHTWWANLGENRAKKAREEGFVVVTGLGNHSTSGVSRLRQEVGGALKREGWRVKTETGQFVVTGRI